jgi:plastocyanin
VFPHTASAQDRNFDSGEIAPARTWRYVVRRSGAMQYVCAVHPTMKATLIVK